MSFALASYINMSLTTYCQHLQALHKLINDNKSNSEEAYKIRGEMDTVWAQLDASSQEIAAHFSASLSTSRELDSDSPVASCNCMTKTPEVKFHKVGCKYRLIMERDELAALLTEAKKVFDNLPAAVDKEGWKIQKRYNAAIGNGYGLPFIHNDMRELVKTFITPILYKLKKFT